MDNSAIVTIVSHILRQVSPHARDERAVRKKRAELAHKHKRFATEYPKLFEMCFDPEFDEDQFRFMMSQLGAMNGAESAPTLDDTTKLVCERLNDKYITPLVGKPDQQVDTAGMGHIKFSTSTAGASTSAGP